MEVQTFDIKLAAIEVPKPMRGSASGGTNGARPVLLGERHGFMPRVLKLIKNSPTASAMLGRKAALVAGQGFKLDQTKMSALEAFLNNVAPEGRYRTGNKLLKRLSKDFAKLRGIALQVVWSEDRKFIVELYHQRFETVAPGPMDEEENISHYYLCRDWSNVSRYKVQEIPAFNPINAASNDEKIRAANAVQLAYFYEEDAGSEYFPDLDFQAGLNYMEAEGLLGQFHPNNISNKFSLGSILSVRNGPQDKQGENGELITAAEQQRKFTAKLKQAFTGTAAEQFLVMFGDGTEQSADAMAKLQSYTAGTNETLYESIAKMCQQAILSAGSVTSPEVVGLPSVGGLGGDGGKLVEAYKMYFNTVCRPDQLSILDYLRELFVYVQGVSFEGEPEKEPWLDITTVLPVEVSFSEDTLLALCTDGEMRTMIGLSATPAPAEPVAGAVVTQLTSEQKALMSNPASQAVIDSIISGVIANPQLRSAALARLTIFFGLSEADATRILPEQLAPAA